jgi:two-component sensor histidine kinase
MLELVNRDLDLARQQREAESILRRELLHNVTTHIQSLTAIIDAEIRRLPPGGERDAVQRVRGRVRGAALVYQVSEALQGETAIIGDIVNMTASALKSIYRPWKRITINVVGPQLELPVALVSPLAMIVNESVTNCFKHAFPDNRFGTIDISFSHEDEQFLLSIADDGVGMPANVSHGRGCATITQLINSLGGVAKWSPQPQGTRVVLRLPLSNTSRATTS